MSPTARKSLLKQLSQKDLTVYIHPQRTKNFSRKLRKKSIFLSWQGEMELFVPLSRRCCNGASWRKSIPSLCCRWERRITFPKASDYMRIRKRLSGPGREEMSVSL